MAGRPKHGIDYAGWSVNIFDGDTKIDKLLDAHGWIGFSIYFYLCQMAYKFDGYFYRWGYDDAASTARRMGGGVSSGTVKETVTYCLQIGLFDERTFDEWGVLTSKGIQRRFYDAIQARRVKSVIKKYWLLKDEESKGLEMCAADDDFQPEKEHLQEANSDLQPANDPKSKGKESKGKEEDIYNAREAESKDRHDLSTVMSLYMDHIQANPPPVHIDTLKSYTESMGAEVVEHAITKALDANALNFNYVKAVLQSYAQKKVTTLAQAKQVDQEFLGTRQRGHGYGFNGRNAQVRTIQPQPPISMDELMAALDKI